MKIDILEIRSGIDGWETVFFTVLIEVNNKLFLIDSGYNESFDDFIRVLNNKNIDVCDLSGILITHYDIDHIGGLFKFKKQNPELKIYSSAIEEPSISGKIKSERSVQAEKIYHSMPERHRKWIKELQNSLENITNVNIDITLVDGQSIEGEIIAIHTPGHTKGHLSYYIPEEKLFISGDAFVYSNNKFKIASPRHALDLKESINSIKKIRKLDIEKIICYHGGIVSEDIYSKLDDLIG